MTHYNLRWVENGELCTRDGFDCWDSIVVNDVIIFNPGNPTRMIALRVVTRVITDPVTLICSMCSNPLEEQDE